MPKITANITREDVRKAYRGFIKRGRRDSPCDCLMVEMVRRVFNYHQTNCGFFAMPLEQFWTSPISGPEINWHTPSGRSPAGAYDSLVHSAKSADDLHKQIIAELNNSQLVTFVYPDEIKPVKRNV